MEEEVSSIQNQLLITSCTKCRIRKAQDISLKLAGSHRLIQVPKGKSENLLVVVLGGLHSLCDQLLEIQGQQMQITQDPDTYPMLLQFLPDQGGKGGRFGRWDRAPAELEKAKCLADTQLPVFECLPVCQALIYKYYFTECPQQLWREFTTFPVLQRETEAQIE